MCAERVMGRKLIRYLCSQFRRQPSGHVDAGQFRMLGLGFAGQFAALSGEIGLLRVRL